MGSMFQDFLIAADELDELSVEGFFGEDVKQLVEKRESMETNDYLYDSLRLWIEDSNQYGKENVKEYIQIFFRLYLDAYKESGQETIDILTTFWKGTIENPEMECFSAYSEFARLFTETRLRFKEASEKHNLKLSDKKSLVSSLTNTYSKGVEFIGKILTVCIVLKKISEKQKYNHYRIYNMKLFDKIDVFTEGENDKYKKITHLINRPLRNADAHLSLKYDYQNNSFILKKKFDGKIVNDKISLEDMMFNIFPFVGWIAQAFIYSGILFVLGVSDREKFIQSIKEIYEMNI